MSARLLIAMWIGMLALPALAQEGPPPPENAAPEPVENLTARQQAGKTLFDQSCNFCHGERHHAARLLGKRVGKDKALVAQRKDLTGDYIRYVVRHGIVSMPWYRRSELPDPDLDTIVDYLTRHNAPVAAK